MTEAGPDGWVVERFDEPPATFHARALPAPAQRAVWVCEPTVPSVVLGSTQPTDVVDAAACARAGLEVVRRRSGGGAVLVVPADLVWLDVVVPAGDPLWDDDVGRAAHWLGAVWASALESVGVRSSVHRGAMVRTEWSELVCFAGLGPGEVVDGGGAKVVGLSQRRTRDAARFQCAALLRWDPAALLGALALDEGERARAGAALAGVAAGLPLDGGELLAAVLTRLP